MLIGGTGRLRTPSRARPARRPSLLSRARSAIRSGRVTRTLRRSVSTVRRSALAHTNRLRQTAGAALGRLPWERQVRAVSTRVYNEVKSSQEQVALARKAVKAGRVIRDGLNQADGFRRFTGMVSRTGVGRSVSRAFARTARAASAVSNTVTNTRVGRAASGAIDRGMRVADNVRSAVTGDITSKQKQLTGQLVKSADNFISRQAARAAERLGARGAANGAARVGAKALGRFAPGANIAVAAYDVYKAGQTLRDPNASTWKKGMAVATAGFSVVAATNIPVVSQVAAGLSLATDVASKLSPSKIADGAKDLASGAVNLGKKIFGGL